MAHLPPFRTRRSSAEPADDSPPWDDDTPELVAPAAAPPLSERNTAPDRVEPQLGHSEVLPTPEPDIDDDAVPVLTQIVEPDHVPEAFDDDEELVARITAAVLDAVAPVVAAAVRRELARARGEDPEA